MSYQRKRCDKGECMRRDLEEKIKRLEAELQEWCDFKRAKEESFRRWLANPDGPQAG